MSKDKNGCCQSFYKGKTDEEIKDDYNQKWIEILKTCYIEKIQKLSENDCRKENKHDIINPTANKTCSAQRELNKL